MARSNLNKLKSQSYKKKQKQRNRAEAKGRNVGARRISKGTRTRGK